MMLSFKLGTRGSRLALRQAEMVREVLLSLHSNLEISLEVTKTERADISLKERHIQGLDKGIFTTPLEKALRIGEIDFAVHSLKDLPADTVSEDLELWGTLPRGATRDIFLSLKPLTLESLVSERMLIGTESIRRMRQFRFLSPNLSCIALRGNIDTRLQKLFNQNLDAIILAESGLERLGYETNSPFEIDGKTIYPLPLPLSKFPPSACQGIIGIQGRREQSASRDWIKKISCKQTFLLANLERRILQLLGANCQTALGISSELQGEDVCVSVMWFKNEKPLQIKEKGKLLDWEKIAEKVRHNLQK